MVALEKKILTLKVTSRKFAWLLCELGHIYVQLTKRLSSDQEQKLLMYLNYCGGVGFLSVAKIHGKSSSV